MDYFFPLLLQSIDFVPIIFKFLHFVQSFLLIIYKHYKQMDLQFMLDEESLETLCFHYIINQAKKSKTLIINSILMKLVSTMDVTLYELFQVCCRIVDENRSENNTKSMIDKEYYKNLANLIREVLTKYPKIINTASQQQLVKIIKFSCGQAFCAVSGNDYIALVALIMSKQNPLYPSLNQAVQAMILSNKMCVGSYRQSTRLHLYSMLLKILKNKNVEQLSNNEYINRVIRTIEDQKDPRNISYVFQIYSHILDNSKLQTLQSLKKRIFDCLQMYYPIDFEGDADKHSIKLHDISALLDRCLTHQLFANQVRALLMIKMGAAPIGKYISTFILTRKHPVTQDSTNFWANLLLRTAEEQYLQEQYEQNAQYTLSDLIVQLLSRLTPNNAPFSYFSYNSIINWMNKFIVQNVFNTDQNSKAAGLIIAAIKDIMKKCNIQIKNILASYTIYQFLSHSKSPGDIMYKLGMLVPIFECKTISYDPQNIGLLVLTLSKIYHQVQQSHPKLIVLKLYMLLSTSATYLKMINQTNIQHSIIQKLNSDESDSKIIKSYIDFLVQIYPNQSLVQTTILNIPKIDNKMYGVITLSNKVPTLKYKITELLQQKQNHQAIFKQFINVIRILKPEAIIQTISQAPSTLIEEEVYQISKIVDEKYGNIEIGQQDTQQFISKCVKNVIMAVFTKNLWRSYLLKQNIRKMLKTKIQIQLEKQEEILEHLGTLVAFYNKSIDAFKLPITDKIQNEKIKDSVGYRKQIFRMLPIQKDHYYTGEECKYWPTLVDYSWRSSQELRSDLIQYLPTSILASQAHKILPIIIPTQNIEAISKIIKNVPEETVIIQLIPFVVGYLQSINQSTEVEKIVSCNKILYQLENRAKQEQQIHRTLLKYKGRILVALEEKLLQHRKRRARQSSRAMFALYNTFK